MLNRFFITNPAANFNKQVRILHDFFGDPEVMQFSRLRAIWFDKVVLIRFTTPNSKISQDRIWKDPKPTASTCSKYSAFAAIVSRPR